MGKLIRLELFSTYHRGSDPIARLQANTNACIFRFQVLQGPPYPLIWRLVLHLNHRSQWLGEVELVSFHNTTTVNQVAEVRGSEMGRFDTEDKRYRVHTGDYGGLARYMAW